MKPSLIRDILIFGKLQSVVSPFSLYFNEMPSSTISGNIYTMSYRRMFGIASCHLNRSPILSNRVRPPLPPQNAGAIRRPSGFITQTVITNVTSIPLSRPIRMVIAG